MIPSHFEYHKPDTIDQVITLLVEYGDEAKVLAGGHSLLPMMKLRFAEPAHLIDLKNIENLRGIREDNGVIHIGAMTTENELIDSKLLLEKCPLIPEAAKLIADPQVRNKGTIGGDVAHGDPGNDHPAIMLALDASFVLCGNKGERIVKADAFFLGTFYTLLEESEILKEIQIPIPAKGSGYAYKKLKRKTGDFATAAAAVQCELKNNKCKSIIISLTNVAPMAIKAIDAAALLQDKIIDEALIEQAAQKVMDICEPAEDLRGDIEYKTFMAGEMTRRAIRLALERAKGAF